MPSPSTCERAVSAASAAAVPVYGALSSVEGTLSPPTLQYGPGDIAASWPSSLASSWAAWPSGT
jgi:hypothetical protein